MGCSNEEMQLLSHRRRGVIQVYSLDDTTYRVQAPDICPACGNAIMWEQEADVWTVDDRGEEPAWSECSAWHSDCQYCNAHLVDPHDDGLIRAFWRHDEDVETASN